MRRPGRLDGGARGPSCSRSRAAANRLDSLWGGVAPQPQGRLGACVLWKAWLYIYLFIWPGLWPRNNMYAFMVPSVDCPGGPGLGAQPRRFQNGIRSAAASGRKRRGGKGRRPSLLGCFALGACLFLSLLRVRQAVSGCRRGGGGGMSVAAGPREGTSGTATSQCPARSPLPAPPRFTAVIVVAKELWIWTREPGEGGCTGLPACSVTHGFLCAHRLVP